MPPKKNARDSTPAATPSTSTPVRPPTPKSTTNPSTGAATWDQVIQNIYNHYIKETSSRTKLIDAFLVFLLVVAALQFAYCIFIGNYPFNAFLSGFSATIGQFVLAISLRIQTTPANKADFPAVSPERAFADFVVCSLILHVFCINFIN